MQTTWLKRKLTVEQAERLVGKSPKWENLLAQMQPGDELWEFSSSDESWEKLAGEGGIALLRAGKVVANMVTVVS